MLCAGSYHNDRILWFSWLFSLLQTTSMCVLIWVFRMTQTDAALFSGVSWWIDAVLICATVGTTLKWVLIKKVVNAYNWKDVLCGKNLYNVAARTKERSGDIDQLLEQEAYDDVIELMLFKCGSIAGCVAELADFVQPKGHSLLFVIANAKNRNEELFCAVRDNEELEPWMKQGKYLTLAMAAQKGDAEFVQQIFESDWITPQIVMKTEGGRTALSYAIEREDISVLQAFVDDITQFNEEERCEILNSAVSRDQMTALHRAALMSSLSVFRIVYDAYPETKKLTALQRKNKRGKTALDLARDEDMDDIVQFIESELARLSST